MGNDKTQWIFDDGSEDAAQGGDGAMTESLSGRETADATLVGSDEATVAVGGGPIGQPEKTMIHRGGDAEAYEADVDPVTGWLVVVRGPGLGRSVQLGGGMNAVGRGTQARAALPFGDARISSDDHVRIIYDDEARGFLIVPGSGANVSRVNGALLTATTPLPAGSRIELSKETTVVFQPFCSETFDWSDLADADGE